MFLFLIELYFLGVLITKNFAGRLPDFFLAVTSILVGYLAYVLNGLILVSIGIPLTQLSMVLMVSLEIVGLLVFQIARKEFLTRGRRSLWLHYLGTGFGYFGIVIFFYLNNLFFVTTDSVYMVVMGRNLLESGLSQWYFASPRGMGLFVPLLQTLGMLFGRDYTWFVQPAFMVVFLILFAFFGMRSGQRFMKRKVLLYLLVIAVTILLFSSDLIFIMTTYIHTNFNSGLFLFLAIATLYFGIIEENSAWFIFTPLFLIGFGAMRVENVVIALVVILIFAASKKITQRVKRQIFLPYLAFQFLLYLRILFMDPNTYSDQMSDGQILITLLAILITIALLFLVHIKLFKQVLFPLVWWALPAGLFILFAGFGIANSDQLINNLAVYLKTVFVTGNWGAVWWVVVALFTFLPVKIHFPLKRELFSIILSFFLIIQLLGLFRVPYHDRWFDSANRILVHITPVLLFYLVMLIAKAGSKNSKGAESVHNTTVS